MFYYWTIKIYYAPGIIFNSKVHEEVNFEKKKAIQTAIE